MDSSQFTITLSSLVAGLVALGWYLFQRQMRKSDESDKDARAAAAAELSELKAACAKLHEDDVLRMNQHGERIRAMEIELERRVTRDDLKDLRAELKDDMQKSSLQIIAALKAG